MLRNSFQLKIIEKYAAFVQKNRPNQPFSIDEKNFSTLKANQASYLSAAQNSPDIFCVLYDSK
jgi:hypothetical protein